MSYCPICGNTDPDYKCKCIEETTGIKPGAKIYKAKTVKREPQTTSQFGAAWADIYETLICGQG